MSYIGSIKQAVEVSFGNTDTSNLPVGGIFTGIGVSTLGVNAIQVNLKCDQNCTVYVEQGPDATTMYISDSLNYQTNLGGFGWTTQATDAYTRVRVKNVGTATTAQKELSTVLCPIVEALPRALSQSGNLKTGIHEIIGDVNDSVMVSPYRELQVEEPVKLVGSAFYGTTLDTNFWTATVANGGTTVQSSGELNLRTNTDPNGGQATVTSTLVSRYIPGSALRYRGQFIQDVGIAENTRIWGMSDSTDGVYFKLDGTALSVVGLNTGVETPVFSGSFNGNLGMAYVIDSSNHSYDIVSTNGRSVFYVDGQKLHKISVVTSRISGSLNLPIMASNINSNGFSTDVQMKCITASIARLGKAQHQPRYKYQTGTTAANVCKYGTGNLQAVIISAANTSNVTLYDSTTASGSVIFSTGSLDAAADLYMDFKGLTFVNGLTLNIAAASSNVTVIYE